jgi:DNA-binding XRE family transcriptional regulator
MAARKRSEEAAGPGVSFEDVLAARLRNPRFKHAFEERRMVHEVAIAVRAMRERAHLTQLELARRIGSSQPSIARIEKGLGYRTPHWETPKKIATALGKQLKLSFVEADAQEPLVEVDGLPVGPAGGRDG